MAGVDAIHAVGAGLETWLARAHAVSAVRDTSCAFRLVGVSQFTKLTGGDPTLSLLLHRVSHNPVMRNAAFGGGDRATAPLVVDLHYMATVWADSPLVEHLILAWVAREFHRTPVLGRGVLGPGFDDDLVQLTPDEVATEAMSQLWGMLSPPYRPSLFYVVRNVRIEGDPAERFPPVIADRIVLEQAG